MDFSDKTFVVSALANLAAAYNLAITGHVLIFLSLAETPASEVQSSAVASASLIGAIFGQLLFGSYANLIGLQLGLAIALFLCIIGNFLASFVAWGDFLFPVLILSRFIVGLGSGGVYPLSAVASAESARNDNSRGQRMILVFSFQGVAQFLAPLTVLILNRLLPRSPNSAWRILLLLASLPSAVAIPQAFKLSTERLIKPAGNPLGESRWSLNNLLKLFGTAGSWFLFDIVFYGNVIFTPFMLKEVFKNLDLKTSPMKLSEFSTAIYLLALPGVYLASFYSDILGRKLLQIIGFSACSFIFLLLAILFSSFPASIMFGLYLITFFFYNFGPNSTTFCLPAETFEPENKSFFNGISAACGKLGAVLGAAMFKVVLDAYGLRVTFFICALICFSGSVFTLVFVKEQSLNVSEFAPLEREEDPDLFNRLTENSDAHSIPPEDVELS